MLGTITSICVNSSRAIITKVNGGNENSLYQKWEFIVFNIFMDHNFDITNNHELWKLGNSVDQ